MNPDTIHTQLIRDPLRTDEQVPKKFMSNLCRPVEKITESVVGNINVKWSFGLAANDTDREEVAVT